MSTLQSSLSQKDIRPLTLRRPQSMASLDGVLVSPIPPLSPRSTKAPDLNSGRTRPTGPSPAMRRGSLQFTPPSIRERCLRGLRAIEDNVLYNSLLMLATLWALFIFDIAILAIPTSADYSLNCVTFAVVILFTLALFISLLCHGLKYIFSIYSILDVISILSLIPNVLTIFGVYSGTLLGYASTVLVVARAGRAARAVARLPRFISMVKLHNARLQAERERRRMRAVGLDSRDEDKPLVPEPSQIGSDVNERIVVKVIILVLGMLVACILLSPFTWRDTGCTGAIADSLSQLALLSQPGMETAFNIALTQYRTAHADDLLYLEIDGTVHVDHTVQLMLLREAESLDVNTTDGRVRASFSRAYDARLGSALGIGLTCFVIIWMGGGNILLFRDITQLLLGPIERMATNMNAMTSGSLGEITGFKQGSKGGEVAALESFIGKFAGLLQIGLGVYGARVISPYLRFDDKAPVEADKAVELRTHHSVVLDATRSGRRVTAVFCSAEIGQFVGVAEALQEEALVFVNIVTRIVHEAAVRNGGQPNRTTGDTFLMVWELSQEAEESREVYSRTIRRICESAYQTCLEIIFDMEASAELQPLIARLGPTYRMRMLFALHVGWAVVGAVGSAMKVDATYMSPHSALSTRMRDAARIYKVEILVTQTFFELLSKETRARLRKVDSVMLRGFQTPIIFYTSMPRRQAVPEGWLTAYANGIDEYLGGRWEAAGAFLTQARTECMGDGPSEVILGFMQRSNFVAPVSWEGHRTLPI